VFFFSVLIPEVIWLSSIPVLIGHRFACGHPEEFSLLSLVSATGPEVFMAHSLYIEILLTHVQQWIYLPGLEASQPARSGDSRIERKEGNVKD
jgi:hypothetical protein